MAFNSYAVDLPIFQYIQVFSSSDFASVETMHAAGGMETIVVWETRTFMRYGVTKQDRETNSLTSEKSQWYIMEKQTEMKLKGREANKLPKMHDRILKDSW